MTTKVVGERVRWEVSSKSSFGMLDRLTYAPVSFLKAFYGSISASGHRKYAPPIIPDFIRILGATSFECQEQ